MSGPSTTLTHPVLSCAATVESALKDVADVEPVFMGVADKRAALLRLSVLTDRLEELRLRVLAASGDVADADGSRDVAAWVARHTHRDSHQCRRDLRLARTLEADPSGLGRAVRDGRLNLAQTAVIDHSLHDLPEDLPAGVVSDARVRLIDEATSFGPRELHRLGRRILDVVAPEIGETHEAEALEREERAAARKTYLKSRRNGDGTTDLRMRVADLVADRLLTYLAAFTSPRQNNSPEPPDATPRTSGPGTQSSGSGDRRPCDQLLGHAFGALLETIDPTRLPLHGGTATTLVVTIDLTTLLDGLGVALVGDQPITAGEARRLACTAGIVPAVLGGDSQILDLGRTRRLFSPAQRTAMAVRDTTCRAEGCDIPAAWCEAHHAGRPWSAGGRTDLDDGMLLCSHHHRRAHDPHYDTRTHTNGGLRFHRRT